MCDFKEWSLTPCCDERDVFWKHSATFRVCLEKQEISILYELDRGRGRRESGMEGRRGELGGNNESFAGPSSSQTFSI